MKVNTIADREQVQIGMGVNNEAISLRLGGLIDDRLSTIMPSTYIAWLTFS